MGNGPQRAMRTHLGNSIVKCLGGVATGVQQGPGFTVESTDTRFEHGTVGAAALDKDGNLAAGTSTGGLTNKRFGRIGDSPIIGAGTYADNRTCAVSATGWGEYFIRTGVTQDIHGRMLHGGESLISACEATIFDEMGALGGDGGVVSVDAMGNVALVYNSTGMFRASARSEHDDVVRTVAMFGPYEE